MGWLFQLAYRLERHYFFQLSLRRWLWALIVGPPLLAMWHMADRSASLLVAALAALTLVATEWARRRREAIFVPLHFSLAADTPIAVDEQVKGWAYGHFGVEGREAYLADVEAYFSYVPTREHVIMARVRRTRFLLLACSPADETGWWYAFFTPPMVRGVETGYVRWGLRRRPALAIRYLPEGQEEEETLYMAFADEVTVGRVLADLRRDVPAGAFGKTVGDGAG